MAQACIFLATGYEEVEMLTVVDMLRRAKISIDMVSITDQKEVTSSHNVTITADKTLSEVNFEEAEMLILPGGIPGTPNLRACTALCEKLKEFAANGKKVAAVCAAPTVPGRQESNLLSFVCRQACDRRLCEAAGCHRRQRDHQPRHGYLH